MIPMGKEKEFDELKKFWRTFFYKVFSKAGTWRRHHIDEQRRGAFIKLL